jgi:hypothetical protein
MEPKKRKKRIKTTASFNLSSVDLNEDSNKALSFDTIEEKVNHEINNDELRKCLWNWDKQFKFKQKINNRDLNILKNTISEYMGSFLLFGYNFDDDRIILQKFENPRDRDAIMEFLKVIFIKQQTENFLD